MRKLYLYGFITIWLLGTATAQNPARAPAFEVASIKLWGPLDPVKMVQQGITPEHLGLHVTGTRVDIGLMSLSDLIQSAYGVKRFQLIGPDWMGGDRFDILAKLPEGASKELVPAMLQSLLTERFKLTIHHEMREQPVWDLTLATNGPKLKASAPESGDTATSPPVRVQMIDGVRHMEYSRMSLAQLADTLSALAGRPVVDKTGLSGTYQISLALSVEDLKAMARAAGVDIASPAGNVNANSGMADPPELAGSTLTSTLRDLGLKLEPRKQLVDTIVIDHLERRPTED